MIRMPVTLAFYARPTSKINGESYNGGFLRDVTKNLQNTWRRSIRDIGGYWVGKAKWEGADWEMRELFQDGMLWEIRELVGGMITWQGFLAEMELTYNGQHYIRSWSQLANKVKTIYSKIGENMLDLNSVEESMWPAYGSPTVREQSDAWATHLDKSGHIVAANIGDGVIIQNEIPVSKNKPYQGRITVKIISGAWRLEIYESDNAENILDYTEEDTPGQSVVHVSVSDDHDVTKMGLRLYCASDGGGEIYADAAVFQLAPTRAETGWFHDKVSQAEYGVIERILLGAGMTDDAADGWAQRELLEDAWAIARPPAQIYSDADREKTALELTFLGYVHTLRNYYTTLGGREHTASTLVSRLVSSAEFLKLGEIIDNDLSFLVEDIEAYRVWNLVEDIARVGDADGNRWMLEVLKDRLLHYRPAADDPVARVRDGRLIAVDGGVIEGWYAKPGIVKLDDILPVFTVTSNRILGPDLSAWMSEVEFDLGKWLAGEDGVTYRSDIL